MTKSNNSQAISHSCVSNLSKNESQSDLSIKEDNQIIERIERAISDICGKRGATFSIPPQNTDIDMVLAYSRDLIQEQQKKLDELQKRVDAVLRLIEPLLVCELYAHEAMKIEQALKGGDQNTEKQPNKHAENIATKGVKGGDQ